MKKQPVKNEEYAKQKQRTTPKSEMGGVVTGGTPSEIPTGTIPRYVVGEGSRISGHDPIRDGTRTPRLNL